MIQPIGRLSHCYRQLILPEAQLVGTLPSSRFEHSNLGRPNPGLDHPCELDRQHLVAITHDF
jgi:hypothetical protein